MAKLDLRYAGQMHDVRWFPGTEDTALLLAIKAACGVGPHTEISVLENGVHLAIDAVIPSDITVDVHLVLASEELPSTPEIEVLKPHSDNDFAANNEGTPLLLSSDGANQGLGGGVGGTRDTEFQGQLLKFERINAHLANERTYLAWARTCMSIITVAFTLKSEAISSFSDNWSIAWFISSALFLTLANYVWYNGWVRYTRVKDVCMMNDLKMAEQKMASDGAGFQLLWFLTMTLGFSLFLLLIMYVWYGTSDEVRLV